MFYGLSPSTVVWLVVASVLLFVAAPHLDVVARPAARTVRLGAIVLVLQCVAPFGLMLARHPEWAPTVQPVLFMLFWASFALAAFQMVKGAEQKPGGLL